MGICHTEDAAFVAECTRTNHEPDPPANAVCERVIGTIRCECLDRILILGRRHLKAVLAEYVEHYDSHRSNRSLSQGPLPPPMRHVPHRHTIGDVDAAMLRRAGRLGGLIHKYQMVA
jgi:hypothetical protein